MDDHGEDEDEKRRHQVLELQREQDGVIARRQLRAAGVTDAEIERRLRRNEWSRVHPGVYVDHTGPLTWRQQAWAAVLFHWPAALADDSALSAAGIRGYEARAGAPIRVCVDRRRSVKRRVGISVRQIVRFETLCHMNLGPPRQRVEHALLDVAARKRRLEGSVAVLADAVQDGRTTPARLVAALDERPRLRHRAILREVLADVATGVRSVLEHRYLTTVERPHGLPTAHRQRNLIVAGSSTYRDVDYVDLGVVVELDGRLGHDDAEGRWDDLDRDIAAAVQGDVTMRVGWRQVLDGCRLARAVASVLFARGWAGPLTPCGPDCAAFSAPGAEDAAQTG